MLLSRRDRSLPGQGDLLKASRAAVTLRRLATLTVCVLVTILVRVPAHAQQAGQPIFEPGFEGEIWKTRPPHPIGRKMQAPCILPEEWVLLPAQRKPLHAAPAVRRRSYALR
jgi:hypothetical protein